MLKHIIVHLWRASEVFICHITANQPAASLWRVTTNASNERSFEHLFLDISNHLEHYWVLIACVHTIRLHLAVNWSHHLLRMDFLKLLFYSLVAWTCFSSTTKEAITLQNYVYCYNTKQGLWMREWNQNRAKRMGVSGWLKQNGWMLRKRSNWLVR